MKKSMKTLLLGTVMAGTLLMSTQAANFDSVADKLKDLGLFQGTQTGYELDRTPTRAEAATMLVRLLGKEGEAKTLTYSAPFTDLDEWQKPYVQYLYQNKLTTGATPTTFDPKGTCSAQMYTTFLLRALGYSDANSVDFTYATAMEKGRAVGVVDVFNCNEKNFIRDNVVAMSYTALDVTPKDMQGTLLDKLVAEGAVSADKAKATQAFFSDYNAYTKVATELDNQSMSAKMVTESTSKIDGKDAATVKMDVNMAVAPDKKNLSNSKLAMQGKMMVKVLDEKMKDKDGKTNNEMDYSTYYTQGNMYTKMGDMKIKIPMDFSKVGDMMGKNNYSTQGIVAIASLKKETKGAQTIYTMEMNDNAMKVMMQNASSMMPNGLDAIAAGTLDSMKFGKMQSVAVVENNQLKEVQMQMDYSVTLDPKVASGMKSMETNMVMKMTNIQYGSGVKVELPTDLASYQTLGA